MIVTKFKMALSSALKRAALIERKIELNYGKFACLQRLHFSFNRIKRYANANTGEM